MTRCVSEKNRECDGRSHIQIKKNGREGERHQVLKCKTSPMLPRRCANIHTPCCVSGKSSQRFWGKGRVEPCVLPPACATVVCANVLLVTAIICGWLKSSLALHRAYSVITFLFWFWNKSAFVIRKFECWIERSGYESLESISRDVKKRLLGGCNLPGIQGGSPISTQLYNMTRDKPGDRIAD